MTIKMGINPRARSAYFATFGERKLNQASK